MPRQRFNQAQLRRSGFREIVFPISCGRVEYFVRGLIFNLIIYIPAMLMLVWLEQRSSSAGAVLLVFMVLSHLVFMLLGCIIPRLRDLQWSPWTALLTFVPGVNVFLALALLFTPGKPIR